MPDLTAWATAVAVAAACSAICLLVGYRHPAPDTRSTGNGVALAAVMCGAWLGHAALDLWPRWPPVNALDRLLTIVLPVAAAVELAGGWRAESTRWRVVVRCCLALFCVRMLLLRSVYVTNDGPLPSLPLACAPALLVVVQLLSVRLWIRTRHSTVPLTMAAAVLTAGLLVMLAGYLKGGTAALPWAAALAGVSGAAIVRGNRDELQGVTALAAVALFGISFIGRFFGGLSTLTALLLLMAPLLGWLAELPRLRGWASWQRECLRLLLVGVLLLACLLLAKRKFDRELAPLLAVPRKTMEKRYTPSGPSDTNWGQRVSLFAPRARASLFASRTTTFETFETVGEAWPGDMARQQRAVAEAGEWFALSGWIHEGCWQPCR